MKNHAKFGFMTGLLAGTALVAATGLMLGAAEPQERANPNSGERLVAARSPDGSSIELYRVEAAGTLTLVSSTPVSAGTTIVRAPTD